MPTVSDRGSSSRLTWAAQQSELALREVSRIVTAPVRRYRFRQTYGTGCDVMSRDWDNLLVLDACRYDIFEQVNHLEGNLDSVISKGSHSEEFYKRNFEGELYDDTIMISANPYTPIVAANSFFHLKTTFERSKTAENKPRVSKVETDEGSLIEATHTENVHPERLNELGREAMEKYPNKRLIVHYMQPHDPYFGSTAEDIRESFNEEGIRFRYWADPDSVSDEDPPGLMNLARNGYLSPNEMVTIYKENLQMVLESVAELISDLDGKTVVTADHGELLGEQIGSKRFFHYNNMYTEEVRKVPWFTVQSGTRRQITGDTPVSNTSVEETDLEEHLELLGYK